MKQDQIHQRLSDPVHLLKRDLDPRFLCPPLVQFLQIYSSQAADQIQHGPVLWDLLFFRMKAEQV